MLTRKPNSTLKPWRAHFLGGQRRRELGIVYAPDRVSAKDEAMRVFEIPAVGHNRIVVEPE